MITGSPLVSASFIGKHKNGARNLVGCAIFGFYQQILKLKVVLVVGLDPASPSCDVQLPLVWRFAGQHMRHLVEEPVELLIDWETVADHAVEAGKPI
jgi:hypothetical protein